MFVEMVAFDLDDFKVLCDIVWRACCFHELEEKISITLLFVLEE